MNRKYAVVGLLVSSLGAAAFTALGKLAFERPRPVEGALLKTSYSFPSGYATIAVAFYGFPGYLLIRSAARWKAGQPVLRDRWACAPAVSYSACTMAARSRWPHRWRRYLWPARVTALIPPRTRSTGYLAQNLMKNPSFPKKVRNAFTGIVIARGAGCTVTDLAGDPDPAEWNSLLVAHPERHDALREALQAH